MDLEMVSGVLGRVCLSSILITFFFGFLWIVVYALKKVTLTDVMGYMALLWLIIAFASGFLAVICYIWSDLFD